jgi:predicted MPP superfamily phosphohydrolase
MPFVFRIPPVQFLFIGSQIYFLWRAAQWGKKHIASQAMRALLGGAALAVYFLFFALNTWWTPAGPDSTRMTLRDALVSAPFLWWIFSSTVAFFVVILIAFGRLLLAPLRWIRAAVPAAPSRRVFLERTANAAVAAPFVAGAYGLLYGRLNLQTTQQPVYLERLPKAFHGFRIVQLSDIHIGPFMDEDEIRKYVRIANSLKADLVSLTGDFITFDPSPQQAVVSALSGLRAPYGVFGCLGNHDAWADAEDSLTRLFGEAGVRILRQQRVSLTASGDHINLAGIDFANSRRMSAGYGHMNSGTLEGLEKLLEPGAANILLSHNPETFDRAAQLGVDLSLAGHTHGGQLALEFISPELAPSRIVTPYVAGWFQQPGGQLYVNRGIGTIAAPMRVGAPPEISVLELRRA